jgi:hypothetical protein
MNVGPSPAAGDCRRPPAGRRRAKSIARFARRARWSLRASMAALVLGTALATDRPPAIGIFLVAVVVVGIVVLVEPLMRSDEHLGQMSTAGTVTLDDAGVHLPHESVLAADAFIPWDAVSAVVLDAGRGWGFTYEAAGSRRRLWDNPLTGLNPLRRPPLLSAGLSARTSCSCSTRPSTWSGRTRTPVPSRTSASEALALRRGLGRRPARRRRCGPGSGAAGTQGEGPAEVADGDGRAPPPLRARGSPRAEPLSPGRKRLTRPPYAWPR